MPSHLLRDTGTLEPACPLASEPFQGAETLSVSFSAHSAGCNMRFFSRLLTPRVPIPHPSPSTSAACGSPLVPALVGGEREQLESWRGAQGSVRVVRAILSWCRGGTQEGASPRPSGDWSCDQLPLPVRLELAPDFLCLPTQLGGYSRQQGAGLIFPKPHLRGEETGLGEEAGMSMGGPGGSECEGFYPETCRCTLASFNGCFSSALCPGNPVQDSTRICYLKKFGRHYSCFPGGKTESGVGSSHSPRSPDESGAELARGSVSLGALGAACHLQRPPAQTRNGWRGVGGGVEPRPGISRDDGHVPFKQRAARCSGWTRAQPVGARSSPPTAPPWGGRGRERVAPGRQ